MSEYAPQAPQPQAAQAAANQVMPAQEPLKEDPYKEALQYQSIQRKLSIGAVDDPLEHEADAMADKVMRMPEQPFVQRKCSHCDEDIQRSPLAASITPFIQTKGADGGTASDTVTQQINATKGSGSNMDRPTQSFMESRFGTDFSNVKIHTGDDAVQMSRELNAQAFTVGSDIYFNSGKYNTSSESGKHLLAHELTHTVQQGNNMQMKSQGQKQDDKISDDELDIEGDMSGTEEDKTDFNGCVDQDDLLEEYQSLGQQSQLIPENEINHKTELSTLSDEANNHSEELRLKPSGPWPSWKRKRKEKKECNPFGKRKHNKSRKNNKAQKKIIRCVTKYHINKEEIGAGSQPEVTNKLTDRVFILNQINCTYVVSWDMKNIPDRMIISDNATGNIILDTGMIASNGQQQIQPPIIIRIRVIPNDGTLNPQNSPTIYSYSINKICGVKKITNCYLWGIFPIGHKIEYIPFDASKNYHRKIKKLTLSNANKLL